MSHDDTLCNHDVLDPALRRCLDGRLGLPVGCSEPGVLARTWSRVMAGTSAERQPAYRTVRPLDGRWEAMAPGVKRKILWETLTERSCMIHMLPGASVGSHHHLRDEECVVLEGSLRIGQDLVLHAGDFHVGRAGSLHQRASTDVGALVYLRGALDPA